MFSVLIQAENLFDFLRFNFLADLEILALEVFEIFQQTHPLFSSVTIYTTVDQPPPGMSDRH